MYKILLFIFSISFLPVIVIYGGSTENGSEIIEHLAEKIPLNLSFTDERGEKILLKDAIKKPTVIDFCYYRCSGICTPLMVELADVVAKSRLEPGKDYNILSISIDPSETPAIAEQKKNTMMLLINRNIPANSWRFLTGDSLSIKALTDAVGFGFVKEDNNYLHKGVLIFIDSSGKICRYIYPGFSNRGDFSILTSDFEMSALETSKGEITPTISNVLQTCFTNKQNGKDVLIFSLIFAVGAITVSSVLLIIKKANPEKGIRNRG